MKTKLLSIIRDVVAWWAEPAPRSFIRTFNAGLGTVVLLGALVWLPQVRNFFSDQGFTAAEFVASTTYSTTWSLLLWYDAVWFTYLLYGMWMTSCLMLIFNLWPRVAHVILYVGLLSLVGRYPLILYGGIDVLLFLTFWSMFFGYHKLLDSWTRRMLQVHMCLVYLFAGLSKALSTTWMDGTELYHALQTRFSVIDVHRAGVPELIVNVFSLGTVLLEIAFIFLVWQPKLRRLMVVSMAGLHVGIFFLMNASFFSEIMLVGLLVFLNDEDFTAIGKLWKDLLSRLGIKGSVKLPRLARSARS